MHFDPAVRIVGKPTTLAWWLAFFEGKLIVPEGGDDAAGAQGRTDLAEIIAPQARMPLSWVEAAQTMHYLGQLGGHDCWVAQLAEAPAGWRVMQLRAAMMQMTAPLSALAGRAAQVLEWDRTHRYCGVCGTPTEVHSHDRARTCPACRHVAYPRVSPAMMVLVWREGELLLARSPHYVPGVFSALAGFVEAGESLEDCVRREVAEEVSVRVTDLRYYGSQSWPFPHSLMVAYTARWISGEIVPQQSEIEAAHWFALDALPDIPPRFSISGHLIRDTVEAMRLGRM